MSNSICYNKYLPLNNSCWVLEFLLGGTSVCLGSFRLVRIVVSCGRGGMYKVWGSLTNIKFWGSLTNIKFHVFTELGLMCYCCCSSKISVANLNFLATTNWQSFITTL